MEDNEQSLIEIAIEYAKFMYRNAFEILKKELEKKALAAVVSFVGAHLTLILTIMVLFGTSVAMYKFAEHIFSTSGEDGVRYAQSQQEEFKAFANDPEKLLELLDLGKWHPGNEGNMMLSEKDIAAILKSVVDYDKKRKKNDITVRFKLYHHYLDMEETPVTEPADPDDPDSEMVTKTYYKYKDSGAIRNCACSMKTVKGVPCIQVPKDNGYSVTTTTTNPNYKSNGISPFANGFYTYKTSGLGYRNISYGSKNHKGVDFHAPAGTPLFAPVSGTVTYAGWVNRGGYAIYIKTSDGYTHCFMHMQSPAMFSTGDTVTAGVQVGYSGNTGGNYAPHLHYQVEAPAGKGVLIGGKYWVDPTEAVLSCSSESQATAKPGTSIQTTTTTYMSGGIKPNEGNWYKATSLEAEDEYRATWQEIYCLVVMDSIIHQGTYWHDYNRYTTPPSELGKETIYSTKNFAGTELTEGGAIIPKGSRLRKGILEKIIQNQQFTFDFWFDPLSIMTGTTETQMFEFSQMENHAYYVFPNGKHHSWFNDNLHSGSEPHEGAGGSTCTVCMQQYGGGKLFEEDKSFDYKEAKIPVQAPNYAMSSYATYIWDYDENGVIKGRRKICDPKEFVKTWEEIIGPEFDFEWFMILYRQLPGVDSDKLGFYEELYDCYKKGTVIDKYEELPPEKRTVKLGSNVYQNDYKPLGPGGISNPSNGGTGGSGGNIGPAILPQVGDADGKQPFNVSDNLTMAQIDALFKALGIGPGNALYDGRQGLLNFQNSRPNASVLAVLAIMYKECSMGKANTSHVAHWNWVSQKANSGPTYYSPNGGKVWKDMKALAQQQYPNDPSKAAAWAVEQSLSFFYKKWVDERGRNSYYDCQYKDPTAVYCAGSDAERKAWMDGCASTRKKFEKVCGITR